MNLITLVLVIASLPFIVSLVCLLNLSRLLKRHISGTNGTKDIVKIQCAECQENFDW